MLTTETAGRRKEMFVTVTLAILFGVGTFLFLYLVSGGILIAVLFAAAAIALVGAMHYAIWGRRLKADSSADRESPRL